MGTNTKYLNLYIPDITEKGYVVTKVFQPNYAKIDQEAERINLGKMDKGGYSGTGQDLKNDINTKLDKTSIVDNLTTGGSDKALSAEMGKTILKNSQVTDNPYNVYKRPYGGPTWVDIINKSGIYQIENPTGSPIRDVQGTLLHTQWAADNSLGFQLLNPNYTNRFFIRGRGELGDLTKYKDWAEIFTTSNSPMLKAKNGYQKLPSGLIMQWGENTSNPSTTYNNSFPIAFPNGKLLWGMGYSLTNDTYARVLSNDGIVFALDTNDSTNRTTRWFAIGY